MTALAAVCSPVPVRFERVSKSYGAHRVLDDISVQIRPRAVTALLGPNGSGKTTALRLLLGLERPDSGAVLVGSTPYRRLRYPLQHVGALLDASWVHPRRSARAHLTWLAQASGIPIVRVADALALVGLGDVAEHAVGTFSLGMRQRLGIAATVLGDPAVLVYDEPLNGLDQGGVAWIRQFLRKQADAGRTVLLSTHLLHEVEHGADDVVVLAGRTVRYAGPATGLAGTRPGVAVDVVDADGVELVLDTLAVDRGWSVSARSGPDGVRALTIGGAQVEEVVGVLSAHAVRIRNVRRSDTLTDAYRHLIAELADQVGQADSSTLHGSRVLDHPSTRDEAHR
ncbi:MAG: ATP-binding cassette domain-containing protein [Dermatophilaceae bacterium]